ncbi:O-methyltransferase [Alteraurantiacibacter aestuarii]|uniref:Methyltransferase domain-containing protein n=1 Tax=Alteraurantiacibacter aestuarii TaxID=650004 RepID=A0A844ZIR8_9SPHN|nr:class I SAM-dependent methyltransferase [Alteraurantiacibacter aestuarii]MXO87474.1 methyltransferase domain-containing protein [Alteraurantiacibacter aestuarii]
MTDPQFTNPAAQAVFEQYQARLQQERDLTSDLPRASFGDRRDEFLLPVGAEVGNFLRALAIGREARTILELGTSYGFSTLFLADAARQCGGRVISIDSEAHKQDHARAMLEQAGLAEYVEFRCGDAVALVEQSDEQFDVVLLDIWKNLYVACFEAVYPRLPEGGVLVSDNMIYPEGAREATRALRQAIAAKPDLQTSLLMMGSGVELTVKWSPDSDML